MNYCCPKEGKHRTLLSYKSLEIKKFFLKVEKERKLSRRWKKIYYLFQIEKRKGMYRFFYYYSIFI